MKAIYKRKGPASGCVCLLLRPKRMWLIDIGLRPPKPHAGNPPPPGSGMASPRCFDGYKAPYPPHRRPRDLFPFYCTCQLTNGPPPSPPCSLAPPYSLAAVPPLGPFNHLFLRLTHHIPATDGDHDGVPEPFRSAPVYRRDTISPRSAPSLLNSDLPLITPNLPPNLHL